MGLQREGKRKKIGQKKRRTKPKALKCVRNHKSSYCTRMHTHAHHLIYMSRTSPSGLNTMAVGTAEVTNWFTSCSRKFTSQCGTASHVTALALLQLVLSLFSFSSVAAASSFCAVSGVASSAGAAVGTVGVIGGGGPRRRSMARNSNGASSRLTYTITRRGGEDDEEEGLVVAAAFVVLEQTCWRTRSR